MSSDVDGYIRLNNSAGSDFNMLQFGGTTLSFPAWKRSGANFLAYRADDTGFVSVTAGTLTAINSVVAGTDYMLTWSGRTPMYSPADGNIRLTNAAETDFGLLQFGGTTASFPALKRSGAQLLARFADDSNYTTFTAGTFLAATGSVITAQNGALCWNLRSKMWSDTDGSILLTTSTPSNIGEAATDDFSFLKFGGSTSAYPALKRPGIQLHARLADDSNLAQFVAGTIVSYGNIRCAAGNAIDFLTNTRMWSPIDGNLLLTNNAVTDSICCSSAVSISGDYPLLLVYLREEKDLDLLDELFRAHTYWRRRGLMIDLVIINRSETSYDQDFHGKIYRLMLHTNSEDWLGKRGGIFVLREDQMSEADRILLGTTARVVLDSDAGSLANQLEKLERLPGRLPHFVSILPPFPDVSPDPQLKPPPGLLFEMAWAALPKMDANTSFTWSAINGLPRRG